MSTRCTVSVKDEQGVHCIYRHHDGYPEGQFGVVATIKKAYPYAWKLPRFEADDFAAALVCGWKDQGGGDVRLTKSHTTHGDTEFQYYISQDKKTGELRLKILLPAGGCEKAQVLFYGTLAEAEAKYTNKKRG